MDDQISDDPADCTGVGLLALLAVERVVVSRLDCRREASHGRRQIDVDVPYLGVHWLVNVPHFRPEPAGDDAGIRTARADDATRLSQWDGGKDLNCSQLLAAT